MSFRTLLEADVGGCGNGELEQRRPEKVGGVVRGEGKATVSAYAYLCLVSWLTPRFPFECPGPKGLLAPQD